ncbi:MAG: DMT family transporter [Limimaricola soesokkakensis]|uniref:DMT family transporter n=1 Tax=Limimaricola soesokkakensis TaxID=1343159 RepID=UPI004057DFC7
MTDETTRRVASLLVVTSGVLWGFYWLPVRRLEEIGLSGAWGTFAITLAATVLLSPAALARRRLRHADPWALASVALGGAAFMLYSVGFIYGRVAIIILLFFLTPVWSTLIGRLLGWNTPKLRLVAIAAGLAGLAVMLGADGEWPLPRGAGEWLALASGLMWSVSTTGIRLRPALAPPEAAFVFATGASAGALAIAPLFGPLPGPGVEIAPALVWSGVTGGLWWGVFMAGLMWATTRLEPARTGILLMSEVLVGALSAAWLAGEHLGPLELAGGALVLCAGVLEVWPVRRPPTPLPSEG